MCLCSLSRVWLFATLWTPLSMGFSRQEYWNGLPFLTPGRLGSSWSRVLTCISCVISYIGRQILYHSATWEASRCSFLSLNIVVKTLNLDLALLESIYLLSGMKLRTLVSPLMFLFTSPLPAQFLVIYYFYIAMVNNAKVGSQKKPGVTGKFGPGVPNEAGRRLTELCQDNALVIANTLFQQHKRWLYTWTSPDDQCQN